MIDYDDNYFPEDDAMPFTGWATVEMPWTSMVTCQARIRVGADLNEDGEIVGTVWVDDVDWVEMHTVDGFRKGRIESVDDDEVELDVMKLFEALPTERQTELLAGNTLSDIDDRELVVC